MVGLWEAQRTLERGDFIEVDTLNLLLLLISILPSSSPDPPQGVLTVHPPRATIQCQPVGLTTSGGHLMGPQPRHQPWL